GKDCGPDAGVARSGSQYDDANGNGTRDAGEGGVASRTITLDPGTPGDSSDDLTTTTGSDGSYSFSGLKPGVQYTITTDHPAHWMCTDPGGSCDHVLTPQSGDGDVQNLDFGGYTAAHLTIREVVDPGSDPGRFDISVDGTVELAGAGNGDSVQQSVTGGSHSVSQSESGGSGGSYDVQLECRADGGTGDVVPAPNGDVTLASGDDVVGKFRVA